MAFEKEHQLIASYVGELMEDEALELINTLVAAGDDPLRIIESCQKGMQLVGEHYQSGRYFIAGLVMAGEILRQVVEIVQPKINGSFAETQGTGHILLGTVAGDIHDLGKDIVKLLLNCHGIRVTDLGVDIPAETFRDHALALKPDIIGISALITAAFDGLKRTIALLRADPQLQPAMPPIIIGGAQLDANVCEHVGADFWTRDAVDGLQWCLDRLMH